tara:strand:+ start:1295 stop:1849 length:555 start_codon:yes stop_codon:yes gene_type:complete
MKLEIDFEVLKVTEMSADDYMFLFLIYRKGFNYLSILNLKPNISDLKENGYLEVSEKLEDHKVTQDFIDLFVSNFDQMFGDLVDKYPWKVVSPGRGVRVLHAIDPKAKSNDKARNRYKKIVDNKPILHKHIMQCLDRQLLVNKDNLGFLQNLEVWINNYTWEKYENLNDYAEESKHSPRNTRSL